MVDHQFADANSFGLWRKGEWLTKGMAGYGPHVACSDYQNTLAIENPATTSVSFWQNNSDRGSQYVYNGTQDPVNTRASWSPDYAFFESDATATYNNPKAAAGDVQHASRSTVWLKPDFVVTYDRAKTGTANRYKRWWINTTGLASINGREATVTTPAGQQLFVTAVLPQTATLQSSVKETLFNEPAYAEPMSHRLMIQDMSNPQEVRYLTVLQGSDQGSIRVATTSFASTIGTVMDGVRFADQAILFKRDFNAAFTSTTFTVPSSVTHRLVSGLTPNGSYSVSIVPNGNNLVITVTSGGNLTADRAGVLRF